MAPRKNTYARLREMLTGVDAKPTPKTRKYITTEEGNKIRQSAAAKRIRADSGNINDQEIDIVGVKPYADPTLRRPVKRARKSTPAKTHDDSCIQVPVKAFTRYICK